MSERIGPTTVTSFDSRDFLDSNRLEVVARHRVPRRARVARLSGGLPGLILAGLRWWYAGIVTGLFGLLFEEDSNQDFQQASQASKKHIDFFWDLALFSQQGDVSLVGIELITQRSTVYS